MIMKKDIVEYVRHSFMQEVGLFILITCIGLLSLLMITVCRILVICGNIW